MQIYVVKPGDSLWSISNSFGVSSQAIYAANKLQEIPYLVVGQALVIPSTERAYAVKPGDSLFSIARRFNVSPDSIARLNGITDPNTITPGMILRIPEQAKNYGYAETNAFIEPTTPDADRRTVGEVARYLTYISTFSYQINADGSINNLDVSAILDTAKNFRTAPMMVITNFSGGNFNTAMIDSVLKSDQIQQTLIANVIKILQQNGFYGLVIDFERISPENRELYNDFLRKVVAALHPLHYPVATALAPKPNDYTGGAWHGAHDYRAHGQIVDFVIIMTYEWGWSGGPPYAVAPIDLVTQVIRYAVSVMPSKKIMMSIPLYGYDWLLPYMPGGPWAKRVSPQDAIALAAKYGQHIQYDYKVQAPHFNYYDGNGVQHEVWFEDARSVQAKLLLINSFNLRGVSYWELGVSFPQNWLVLDNMYNIVKVV